MANKLKGWGENQRVDSRLLEVRGFDVASNSFVYQVNEGFGQNRRGSSASRNPFALRLTARIAIGGQPLQNNRGFGVPLAMSGDFGGGEGRGGPGAGGRGGGFGGGGFMMGMMRGGAGNVDTLIARAFANPVHEIIALRDSIALNPSQADRLQGIADSLEQKLNARRASLRESLAGIDLSGLARRRERAGGAPDLDAGPPAEVDRAQRALQPELEAGRRDITNALQAARRELTSDQWQKLPLSLRAGSGQQVGRGGFNVVGLIDRMLANPIPVLLELRDTLKLQPDQLARIETVSRELEDKLTRRRSELGKKLDSMTGQQQRQMFVELQPILESTRAEITSALRRVQDILTSTQWQQVPEQVRNPFQRQASQQRN